MVKYSIVQGSSVFIDYNVSKFTPTDTGIIGLVVRKSDADNAIIKAQKAYVEATDDEKASGVIRLALTPVQTNIPTGKYYATFTYREPQALNLRATVAYPQQLAIIEITPQES